MPRKKKPEIDNDQDIDRIVGSFRKTKIKTHKFEFSEKQSELLKIIFDKDTKVVFISGPAGTSKTFMAIYAAIHLFNMNNDYSIGYVRSIIESADRGMGALPGTVDEKFCPFMMPLNDKLHELTSSSEAKTMVDKGIVSAMPINYLRGASFKDQIIIADESQNFTSKELITLLTRIGENTKMLICGDPMQSDINGKSGYQPIMSVFDDEHSKNQGIHTFHFDHRDIKRSEILKFIVKKLEKLQ